MAIAITSTNYAGQHAGQYLAAALRSAASLEHLTVLENIKYKRNITKVSSAGLIVNQSCTFTDTGTITLDERVLEPKNLEINTDICKSTLLEEWQSAQMTAGAHNSDLSSDFAAFVVSYLSDVIADHVEDNIWNGNDAVAGEFTGFVHGTAGTLQAANDATVVQNAAAGAFTATTIDNELSALIAAVPTNVYGKDDLLIYMGTVAYRLYLENQAAAGYQQLYNMGDGFVPMYNGTKIAVCPGFPINQLVAAQKSNMFFGTDLVSDTTELKILNMADLDGSDNVRVVAKFTGGVQHAWGSDIVLSD